MTTGKTTAFTAAAAAKSLQSCPTPCDPIDGNPPGSPIPGILQARTLKFLPFPSPVDHVLSELSTMTHLSWVAPHSMAHSFILLDKAVVYVIRLVSFLIVVFILSVL